MTVREDQGVSTTTKNEAVPAPERHFARALKQALDEEGTSQQALADAMTARGYKFHQATIYKILNGSRKVVLGEAVTMALILDRDLEEMVAPSHETELNKAVTAANTALGNIRNSTFDALDRRWIILDVAASRDDWDPATLQRVEEWRTFPGPEEAVRLGRADWDEHYEKAFRAYYEKHGRRGILIETAPGDLERKRQRLGVDPETA